MINLLWLRRWINPPVPLSAWGRSFALTAALAAVLSGSAAKASSEKVSLNFRDTPLRMVLKVFTLESGLNFVFSPQVAETRVTAQLNQISWDRALVGILASSNLALKTLGPNLAQIYPRPMQNSEARSGGARLDDRPMPQRVSQQIRGRDGQAVFTVNLSHGSAVYLQPRLDKVFAGQDVMIVADEKANGLLIRCPSYRKDAVIQLIAKLDRKPVQVEISSRIVEISTSKSKFAGILLGNRLNFDPGRGLGFGALNVPNSVFSNFTVDPGVSAANVAGNFNLKFASLNKVFDLDLLLKLEEKRGNSKILQSSTLLVTNNEPAKIQSGFSDFFFGFSVNPAVLGDAADNPLGDGSTSLTEVRYNLSLEVTPEVTASGEVLLNLNIVSDIPQASQFPRAVAAKSRRKIETQMIRASGETAVIGGIYDKRLVTNVTRIPLLSDIPLLGPLFRSTSRSITKTELVILVTPKIIYPKGPGAGPLTLRRGDTAPLGAVQQLTAPSGQAARQRPLPPIEARPKPEQLLRDESQYPLPKAPVARSSPSQSAGAFGSGSAAGFSSDPNSSRSTIAKERDLPPIEARPLPEAGPNEQNLAPVESLRRAGRAPITAQPIPEALPQEQTLPSVPAPEGRRRSTSAGQALSQPIPDQPLGSETTLQAQPPPRANGLPPIEAQPQPEAGLNQEAILEQEGPPPVEALPVPDSPLN